MDGVPDAKALRGAAAVARTLAYAIGLVGVIAGGVLYQQAEVAFAMAIWVLTFAMGALLMICAFLLLAVSGLLARISAIESDLHVLVGRTGPRQPDGSTR
jgi:sulfite exporter TauE/SafE